MLQNIQIRVVLQRPAFTPPPSLSVNSLWKWFVDSEGEEERTGVSKESCLGAR